MSFIRNYLLAVQFFTRIPVTGRLAAWVGYSPQMLRASAAHFPGVGWLVGLLVAALSAALLMGLPKGGFSPLVVAALGTAFGILLTGAFHEDGLADVADGLGGAYQRERALEIMKDSRVGAFGAIAIVTALLVKVALIAQLAGMGLAVLCGMVFLAHVVSRTWPLFIIRLLPHVGDAAGSKSKPLAEQITLPALFVALAWCAAAIVLAWFFQSSLPSEMTAKNGGMARAITGALATSAIAFAWMLRMFTRRLQGFTGDCLGAAQQVCELAFYLGFLLAWGPLEPLAGSPCAPTNSAGHLLRRAGYRSRCCAYRRRCASPGTCLAASLHRAYFTAQALSAIGPKPAGAAPRSGFQCGPASAGNGLRDLGGRCVVGHSACSGRRLDTRLRHPPVRWK